MASLARLLLKEGQEHDASRQGRRGARPPCLTTSAIRQTDGKCKEFFMNASKMMLPAVMAFALAGGSLFATDAMSRPVGPCNGAVDCPAEDGEFPCGPRMGRGMFSAEQQQKYDAIVSEFAPKMDMLREAAFVKKHELHALEGAAQPDLKAVNATAKELYQLRADMRKMHREMQTRIAKEVGKPALVAPRHHGAGVAPAPDMPASGHRSGDGHY